MRAVRSLNRGRSCIRPELTRKRSFLSCHGIRAYRCASNTIEKEQHGLLATEFVEIFEAQDRDPVALLYNVSKACPRPARAAASGSPKLSAVSQSCRAPSTNS